MALSKYKEGYLEKIAKMTNKQLWDEFVEIYETYDPETEYWTLNECQKLLEKRLEEWFYDKDGVAKTTNVE